MQGISFAQEPDPDLRTLNSGEPFSFAWQPNTEPDLAGYRIYISGTSGQYTYGAANAYTTVGLSADPGSGPHTITMAGTYFFVVTAYDTEGFESDPSNEVTAIILPTANNPSAPKELKKKTMRKL